MDKLQQLAIRFRTHREELGLTQSQVTARTNLDPTNISWIENAKLKNPQPKTIEKIATFLETTPEDIKSYFSVADKDEAPPIKGEDTSATQQPSNTVPISYSTARDLLALIEAARGGPRDTDKHLNRLMLHVSRYLPDVELPTYLGGTFFEGEEKA